MAEGERDDLLAAVWHEHWGRLLALLVAQYRRLDLAEDALGDAFEAAARHWPRDGTPSNPPAWLLTAARRRALDRLRAEAMATRKLPVLVVERDVQQRAERTMADTGEAVVDERLRLVLLCAHPSLPAGQAAALTLRLVLGVSTEDIARLFLVPTATMAARLTRARKRLAGQSFVVPSGSGLAERVEAVAAIARLAFTAGYAPGSGSEVVRADLAAEGIALVRVLRTSLAATRVALPARTDRELDALLALMLLQHSRRDARVRETSAGPRLVLLPDQDRSAWRQDEIDEALSLLEPHVQAPPSPYLLEALIAAEHAIAQTSAATDWHRVAARYAELEELAPSPGVRLNRAVAVAEADGPLAGLALLDGLDLPGHRLPAVRAELLHRAGRRDEARAAWEQSLALCAHEPERAHVRERLDALD